MSSVTLSSLFPTALRTSHRTVVPWYLREMFAISCVKGGRKRHSELSSSPTNQRYVTSGGLASARHDSRTSVPSSMRPPFSAPPITAIFTLGAYFTSSFSRTDRYVRSAVFCAWQVNVVLWCSFFGVSFRIDLAV
uniref:Uncharacterized protein n=1 Tax=Anopheles merus TaxID=30066 RepID=A0A182V2Y5_ANOME